MNAIEQAMAAYGADVLRARKQRWFIWARGRLRLALAEAGSGRVLDEHYAAHERELRMRGLRADGTPVRVKIKHRDDFRLPSDLAASERGDT